MAWRLAKDRSLTEPIMTPFADVSGPNDLNDRQQTDESAKKYTKYFYKQNDTSGKIWRKLMTQDLDGDSPCQPHQIVFDLSNNLPFAKRQQQQQKNKINKTTSLCIYTSGNNYWTTLIEEPLQQRRAFHSFWYQTEDRWFQIIILSLSVMLISEWKTLY